MVWEINQYHTKNVAAPHRKYKRIPAAQGTGAGDFSGSAPSVIHTRVPAST